MFVGRDNLELIRYFIKSCSVTLEDNNIKLNSIYKCGIQLS